MLQPASTADEGPRQRTRLQARKARQQARERFKRAHVAEKKLARQLKAVARQVGSIVKVLAPNGVVSSFPKLNKALNDYAKMLQPWASAVAEQMVQEVARRDETAWADLGREMGRALREEIRRAPTGIAMKEKIAEAEELITSLPVEAARRVHKLTIEGMQSGVRARETAKEIMRTEEVTASRAMLIARTETTRTATAMVEARATAIGSVGYIWRTSKDSDVRETHKKLEGQYIRWSTPPIAGENGERAHAGAIYNCRCWPEPVIPDVIE